MNTQASTRFWLKVGLFLGTSVSALAIEPPPSVPDSGSTAAFLAIALGGLMVLSRVFRNRK